MLILSLSLSHAHIHTHYKYMHYWWWVGRMGIKKTTDQYAEEKRLPAALLCLWPIRGQWNCHYWHFIVTSHNVEAKAKINVSCVKSPASGLLSAIIIFMKWQTSLLKSQSRSAAAGVAGNTALVWMYNGVEKWLQLLPSHPKSSEPHGFNREMLSYNTQIFKEH